MGLIVLLPMVDTQASSIAGIIAAVGTLITAVGAVLIGWWQYKLARQVKSVHTIVNQQRTDTLRFQEALIRALVAHGIEVPIDQSLPPVPEHDPTERQP